MPGDDSDELRGIPINATTILAALTLMGGLVLATHKLSSDRPVMASGEANSELSEQKMDTRLWEDPLGRTEIAKTNWLQFGNLAADIRDPRNKDFRLLAVMIPGGPAGEDKESRIRSRFAIVSALAESAYAPRQQAQIGISRMRWPTSLELSSNLLACEAAGLGRQCSDDAARKFAHSPFANSMVFAFEWYDREPFLSRREIRGTNQAPVLVVWLDEDQFADYPIPRLDVFFRNLGDTNLGRTHAPDLTESWLRTNVYPGSDHNIMLIGPGRSDTLKAIFANDFNDDPHPRPLGNERTNWTANISVFLASPRAMDQVLITNHYNPDFPRAALVARMTNFFHEVKNFAATDSDLASEILEELKLRGLDFSKTNQDHLVIIGGWDEYFGRMLSAAYAGELDASLSPGARGRFFEAHSRGDYTVPPNLHTFLYLSGLDGEGLSSERNEIAAHDSESSGRERDALGSRGSRWTPDVNRAEGPAQYDYLGRLAARIKDLDRQLVDEGRGKVSAIGIGGGDVYDTLLILQALRPRFPDALFFTTDLDARFWDPKEWKWSRNLLVVSGYGLRLSDYYQLQTAPFRDSQQTATFAATLAALGCTNLPNMTNRFPVRRFEIGREGPVALSPDDSFSPHIHPDLKHEHGLWHWIKTQNHAMLVIIGLACGFLLAICLSRNVRRITVRRHQFMARPLWLGEEDIGSLDGFIEMAEAIGRSDNQEKVQSDLQKRWLRDTIKETIHHEENQMEEDLAGQDSPIILSEADIRDPISLIKVLNGEEGALEHANPGDAVIAERKRVAFLLKDSLPAGSKVAITQINTDCSGVSETVANLVKALRGIINTVDLAAKGDAPVLPSGQTSPHGPLWRRNRIVLNMVFNDLFQPPLNMAQSLFPSSQRRDSALAIPMTITKVKHQISQMIKDPERRDCLQVAMLGVLDKWNSQWFWRFGDLTQANDASHVERLQNPLLRNPSTVLTGHDMDTLRKFRDDADSLINELLPDTGSQEQDLPQPHDKVIPDFKRAASAARSASRSLYVLTSLRWHWVVGICLAAILLGIWMLLTQADDQALWLAAWSGASLWPSNWIYLLGVALGFLFITESYFQLRTTALKTTRQCRLDYRQLPPSSNTQQRIQWRVFRRSCQAIRRTFYRSSGDTESIVHADSAWNDYQQQGRGFYRCCRTIFLSLIYFAMTLVVFQLAEGHFYKPFLRLPSSLWYGYLVWIAFILFLFLSFWTIDAAFLCRWFILRISQGPTLYSLATRQYFSRQRGQVPYHVLSEWIDVSVIAHIAEQVGVIVYFPAALLLLIILGNDNFLYYFPWPFVSYVLVACNFVLALASVVILQHAASKACDHSLRVLKEKLNQLKAGAAVTEAQAKQHDINETEQLLNEIYLLKKNSLGGFWGNPVVGALLVPSGGTAVIEIIKYFVK